MYRRKRLTEIDEKELLRQVDTIDRSEDTDDNYQCITEKFFQYAEKASANGFEGLRRNEGAVRDEKDYEEE